VKKQAIPIIQNVNFKKMIFADPEPYTKNHFFEKLKITKTPISSQSRRENVARRGGS